MAVGLALDTAANFIRYRRPVCAVSAAVTVAILAALSPGVPLWQELLAVAVALLIGKHVWGGAGKNPVNPAVLGLLFLDILFGIKAPVFEPSLLLLPAMLLSLPFIAIRPFAAVGFMVGTVFTLALQQTLSVESVLASGMVFWGCLVMTDPVTTAREPLTGGLTGLLAGSVPLFMGGSAAAQALGILAVNLLSLAAERFSDSADIRMRLTFNKKTRISYAPGGIPFYNLAGSGAPQEAGSEDFTADEILGRIERNGVFGLGGAAFPTAAKIRAVLEAGAGERHFIVNAVECDPGLIHDKWLLHAHMDEIVQGIRYLMRCVPFASVTLAAKYTEGLTLPGDIALNRVPDYYPAGAEKALIKEVLKKALPHDAVPAREGILVLNVQTVFAVYEGVRFDRKADTKLVTAADIGRMTGGVARVRLGDNVRQTVEKVYPGAGCVFTGGGMMNARMASDDTVVDASTNFLATGGFPGYRESPLCSKCGYCGAICPAGLKVNEIADLVDAGKTEKAARLHPERCMACGGCSFVCLAGRNLASRAVVAREYFKKVEN